MAENLNSKKIIAYPVVNRNLEVTGDITSRHTSEDLLTGIVNKLIDTDGFVITKREDFELGKPFSFNIHGYYFKVEKFEDILNLFDSLVKNDRIYAAIDLISRGSWLELAGQDMPVGDPTELTNYKYSSVNFIKVSEGFPAPVGYDYVLELCQYVGDVPEAIKNTKCLINNIKFMTCLNIYVKCNIYL